MMVQDVIPNNVMDHIVFHIILYHLNCIMIDANNAKGERRYIVIVGSYLLITFAASL